MRPIKNTEKRQNHLAKLAEKDKLRVVGLMSGTSADGVDVAVADIGPGSVELLAFAMYAYPAGLRKAIFRLCDPAGARVDELCHWNFVLGEVFAESVLKLCRNCGMDLAAIDLIGSHGQTIYHNPQGTRYGRRRIRSTLQIGEPSVIAQRTGITTVADFRPRDMAAQGQGAPLVPYADYLLFQDQRRHRAIQNIGGIANVTWLAAGGKAQEVIAFDTGPGNMIIDRFMDRISDGRKTFDRHGQLAAQGTVHPRMLSEMLRHPFFRRRPPKTTGREEFGHSYTDGWYRKAQKLSISPADMVATATALTAAGIAQAYERFLPARPQEVILCGGGRHNQTLVKMLQDKLKAVKIAAMDGYGLNGDAKEAVSFALLAYATIKGRANNVPAATGATAPVVLGKIIPAS